MKKILSLGVIILFLGLSVAPSINANIGELNVDDTFVDISTIIEENDEGCCCNDDNSWDFPIICLILKILFEFWLTISPFPVPLMCWVIIYIAEILGCPNIPLM